MIQAYDGRGPVSRLYGLESPAGVYTTSVGGVRILGFCLMLHLSTSVGGVRILGFCLMLHLSIRLRDHSSHFDI
jgi:hypothetical protein